MNPDERFRGRLEKVDGQIPWVWTVHDLKKEVTIAWGEEFSVEVAYRECCRATTGARWWHWYKRKTPR